MGLGEGWGPVNQAMEESGPKKHFKDYNFMKALSVLKLPGLLVLMVRLNAPLLAHWKATPPVYVHWSLLSSRNRPIIEKMGELILTLIQY